MNKKVKTTLVFQKLKTTLERPPDTHQVSHTLLYKPLSSGWFIFKYYDKYLKYNYIYLARCEYNNFFLSVSLSADRRQELSHQSVISLNCFNQAENTKKALMLLDTF